MRTFFISLAAAASALAIASPAAAQWGQAPQGHGYGFGQANHGQVRALQARVQQLRQTIHQLDRRNRLSNREAQRLDRHAVDLQRRIHSAAYRGLDRREYAQIERRIQGLRQAIRYQARDGGRWGWDGQNSHDNGFGYYGARERDDDRRRGNRDDDDGRYGDDDDRRGDRDGRRRDRNDD